jgi:adenosine deaminase
MNMRNIKRLTGVMALVFLGAAAFASASAAQTIATTKVAAPIDLAERKAELNLKAAKQNPLQLRHFLLGMPKGADLHYHLGGGVYAESFLRAGAEDGLCVNVKEAAFVKCFAGKMEEENGEKGKADAVACDERWKTDDVVPAQAAFCDQRLYDALVDSFSMRGFVPYAGMTAHDHFFDTFAKFSGTKMSHKAEWVDEVATRAAGQNEQYMELMETPDFAVAAAIAKEVGWKDDFAEMRKEFLEHDLAKNVKTAVEGYKQTEQKRREMEHCGQADAAAACTVDTRFIFQVLRGYPKEVVFAQTLLGFETAKAAPEQIVGINFVMPEDGYVSMRDYDLDMKIVKFMHETYPTVHITLHAGELAYGLVPPEGLCCHIRLAVEAGAERIGHGVDVMYEEHPHQLMKEMAAKHVMVEINLTSNDVILGVRGKEHPLPLYWLFGVPVALSTDDEGVSRIDLTNEYVRAVETYGFTYADLKKMARTSLEHAFLPGKSLWAGEDVFTRAVGECGKDIVGKEKPSKGCEEFLKTSEKAKQQWELERRFWKFEAEL